MLATLALTSTLFFGLIIFAHLIRRYTKARWSAYCFAVFPGALSIYLICTIAMGRPAEIAYVLSPGLHYERDIEFGAVVHTIRVSADQFSFATTPPQVENGQLTYRAARTSNALSQVDATLAINASFFYPFKDNYLFDYFPHEGDLVKPVGQTLVNGQIWGKAVKGQPKFVVYKSGQVTFTDQDLSTISRGELAHIDFALSGMSWLIKAGEIKAQNQEAYPRTVIGRLSRNLNELVVVVVDGKQPGYSNGISLINLAKLMKARGVVDLIEFDGGGSATVAFKSMIDAGSVVLNRTIHTKIPRRERPVANHIFFIRKRVDPNMSLP